MSQTMNEKLKFKIAIDSKVKNNGLSKVYLRVRHQNEKIDQYVGFDWNRNFFDSKAEKVLNVHDQKLTDQKNAILNDIKSRCNKVLVDAFLSKTRLDAPLFIEKVWEVMDSDENFFKFITDRCQKQYDKQTIVYQTYKRHRSTRNRIMEFNENRPLPFSKINLDYIKSFDAWLRKVKKYSHNSIAGFHKDFKNYIRLAQEENLIFESPYTDFKFKYIDGEREALSQNELITLKKHFITMENGQQKEILRRFLFSCVTGIRISDSRIVSSEMIVNGDLILKETKGSSLYQKTTKIPLSNFAKQLIKNRKGILFELYSNKHINEQLKIIAAYCKIPKTLTFHCARDTFGTIFIEMGGDIKSLQNLMGHTNINTTMIYLKMSQKRKENLMANFDKLLE